MKDLDSITSIKDLKELAKKRTPKMFFDYVESGSWTESTFRAIVKISIKLSLNKE